MYERFTLDNEPTTSTVIRPTEDRDATSTVDLVASMTDVGAVRGVTESSADQAPCTCPEPCERDHANE